ncbi:MAG: NAD(P)-dependent alcohol dehydrogenase, partial [Deltaproteobacteria bacterium]|nr:NAD(P)-dependent alcohol dehydrogenase [Deltaproteobacteria bacterium]
PPEVLAVEDVDVPVPRADEVLIRQHATTVTAADCMMRRGDSLMGRALLGFFRPRRRYRIMGIELAGEVVDVGAKVTRFRRGDRVFGFAGFSVGCYAQYNRLPQDASLAIMPAGLGFEEAAAIVDGGTTALFFLHDLARIQKGDRVLVVGASGSIGTSAVQVASRAGAEVTAVCSGRNADLVGSLGAARSIDYTREDFTQPGEKYDVIFDTVGKSSFAHCRDCLTDDGRFLTTVGGLSEYLRTFWTAAFGRRKFVFGMSIKKDRSLQTLKEMVESGAFVPVIDRRYTLEQIVDAHRYVEAGRKRGNVVVAVQH